MTKADIHSVAKIHKTAFEGFFLEQMGTPFLKAYYSILLNYNGSIALVAVGRNNSIEGFAVGFKNPRAFYRKLKRSKLKLFLPILFGIISNPKLISKVIGNIQRVSNSDSKKEQVFFDHETVELSSIAVISKAKGIGSKLLKYFIEDVYSKDIYNITLTTDSENNELVNKFYVKNGFKEIGHELREGRKMFRYLLSNY